MCAGDEIGMGIVVWAQHGLGIPEACIVSRRGEAERDGGGVACEVRERMPERV